jgi:hypothetical protein
MTSQRTSHKTPGQPAAEAAAVPQRSTRRATARRASARRATGREHGGHLDERVAEYLATNPSSTVGDVAKGVNADRDEVAACLAQMTVAGELTRDVSRFSRAA